MDKGRKRKTSPRTVFTSFPICMRRY